MQADTVKEKLPRSAQRKRQVAVEAYQQTNKKAKPRPRLGAKARLLIRALVPAPERPPAWFVKASLPPSDASGSAALLSAGASWDCNGDGVIDPMERALGRMYMTVDGDVGLHEMALLSQRMKQLESAKRSLVRAFTR